MADDGGFGGHGEDAAQGEQGLDQIVTPQGLMIPEEHEQEQEPAGGDWRDQISDPELREKIGGKYQSVEDVAKAYAELERKLGSGGNEIGELREMMADFFANQQQAQRPDPTPTGPVEELPDYGAVAQYAQHIAGQIDRGELDAGQGIMEIVSAQANVSAAREQARDQAILAYVQEQVGHATAPLNQFQQQQAMGGEIASIKRELGADVYGALANDASSLLREWGQRDPQFIKNPAAIRAAFDRAASQRYLQGLHSAESQTLDGNGPGPVDRRTDPAEDIINGIMAAAETNGRGGFS